jgi:succinyl-CoA synthetase beta subunit
MDIEKVAEETPELILKEAIDPSVGLRSFQARNLAFGLGIPADLINQAAKFMLSLYDAYEKWTLHCSKSIRFC